MLISIQMSKQPYPKHPFHGQGVAKFKCNACGKIYNRDLGWKVWTPSYCEKAGKYARLYRISAPNVEVNHHHKT